MAEIKNIKVAAGIHWVEIPEADLRVLCGAPPDAVKHLIKAGLIGARSNGGRRQESGPNAILLSDVLIQNGRYTNLSEFPVLHMLYAQGMLLPGHPNNTGRKPLLVGRADQVEAQLQYIYRGNYGLTDRAELIALGVAPALADEMMGYKLHFAFGAIRKAHEFIDTVTVEERPVQLRPGVTLRRIGLNRYLFRHRGQGTVVDLNLAPEEELAPPYRLGSRPFPRDELVVVHSGEGDGWDIHRPSMASLLVHRGRVYLVDAGPNLCHTLRALGVDLSEIAGLFHTHAHDDHFAGLPVLMRGGRRIKYFSTALVRASVERKLAALMPEGAARFEDYFEVHDLAAGVWNELDGLEVMPVYAPHPVETNHFLFRASHGRQRRSYAHLADTTAFAVLQEMVAAGSISAGYFAKVRKEFLTPATLKKIDIGGGLIHGVAGDFAEDRSERLLLAHTGRPIDAAQRAVGERARFGSHDVLLAGRRNRLLERAEALLREAFPELDEGQLAALLACPIVDRPAERIVVKRGRRADFVLIPITGWVERFDTLAGWSRRLANGNPIGLSSVLYQQPVRHNYRVISHVALLRIPGELFREIAEASGLAASFAARREGLEVLWRSFLFGDELSTGTQRRLAAALRRIEAAEGETLPLIPGDTLYLVQQGQVGVEIAGRFTAMLAPGEACCGAFLPGGGEGVPRTMRATTPSILYALPDALVRHLPVVQWKLLELHHRWLAQSSVGTS